MSPPNPPDDAERRASDDEMHERLREVLEGFAWDPALLDAPLDGQTVQVESSSRTADSAVMRYDATPHLP